MRDERRNEEGRRHQPAPPMCSRQARECGPRARRLEQAEVNAVRLVSGEVVTEPYVAAASGVPVVAVERGVPGAFYKRHAVKIIAGVDRHAILLRRR